MTERTQLEVLSVVDDNSIKVRDITGRRFTVRVIGIDSPPTAASPGSSPART